MKKFAAALLCFAWGSAGHMVIAAVIFPENGGRFGDLQKLQGQDVEITGTITEYRNRPEIILESPDQIKSAGGK